MTLEASWIRDNMLSSKNSPNKIEFGQKQNNRRVLTEAELKVQRSLEKLSIPAWYLNNSSKPPKILTNQSPIDTRSPSWKTGTFRKKNASSSPILDGRKASGTAFTNRTPKADSKPQEESPKFINRLDTWKVPIAGKIPVKHTQSFPRKSPPRKVENINIVLTPSPKSKPEITNQDYKKNKLTSNTSNSFYESSLNESEREKPRVKVTNLDKVIKSSSDYSFNSTNEWKKDPVTLKNNERNKTSSPSSVTFTRSKSRIFKKLSEYSPDSSPSPTNNKSSTKQTPEKLSEDKTNSPLDNLHSRYLPSAITSKSPTKLTPIDENIEINSKTRPASNNKFMTITKKSAAPEEILEEKIISDNGLIQEIIQELQKKCATKSNATFTRGSKRFVKKLVKVLEDSIDTDCSDNEEKEEKLKKKYADVNKKNYCNRLNKNSISPARKSFKDLVSKSPSPTLSSSPNYNWPVKRQTEIKNRKNNSSSKNTNINWIPLPTNLGIPRTSSAFSMKSSSGSSSRSSNKSLCISPIGEDNENGHFFNHDRDNWSWSCEKNNARRSFGGRKSNGLFDSGYSEVDKNHSLMIRSFLAEYEASKSMSEFDTSANRRLSFSQAPSIFARSLKV